MNKTQSVQDKINKLSPGEVFSVKSLNLKPSPTTRKIFSRMEKKGEIQRIKGRQGFYFIPKKGVLGVIKPSRGKIIKALLDGENKGYRSGLSLYNKLGLTTQVPGEVTIVSNMHPRSTKIEGLDVQYKKTRAPINKENIPLLQYLDVFMDIKDIPDTTPGRVVEQMRERLAKMEEINLKKIVRLSKYYPKRVQALLGAILESLYGADPSRPLREVTQTGSIYKLGIDEDYLPNKSAWNIQ